MLEVSEFCQVFQGVRGVDVLLFSTSYRLLFSLTWVVAMAWGKKCWINELKITNSHQMFLWRRIYVVKSHTLYLLENVSWVVVGSAIKLGRLFTGIGQFGSEYLITSNEWKYFSKNWILQKIVTTLSPSF